MNQHQAIAAVTGTLRRLLMNGRGNNDPRRVSTVSIDRPDDPPSSQTNYINLFLYNTAVNAAWRNTDVPGKVKPGESGHPPLALDLFYLLTAFGEDESRADSHRLLGQAMSILHDSPLLNEDEIVFDNYTHQQIERIRITPEPLSLDELTKLWSTFETALRVSAAYRVGVVLIESTRSTKTPPPVRRRGREDAGSDTPEHIGTHSSPLPPFPTILSIERSDGQPSLEPGTRMTVKGFSFAPEAGETARLELRHPLLADNAPPISIDPVANSIRATELAAELPGNIAVPPGPVSVSLAFTNGNGDVRRSSAFPTAMAPKLLGLAGIQIGNRALIAVRFIPRITLIYQGDVPAGDTPIRPDTVLRPAISLLVGSDEIPFRTESLDAVSTAEPPASTDPSRVEVGSITFPVPLIQPDPDVSGRVDLYFDTDVLVFISENIPPADSLVRLRVDGIDSLLLADRTTTPPQFRGPPDFIEPRITIP